MRDVLLLLLCHQVHSLNAYLTFPKEIHHWILPFETRTTTNEMFCVFLRNIYVAYFCPLLKSRNINEKLRRSLNFLKHVDEKVKIFFYKIHIFVIERSYYINKALFVTYICCNHFGKYLVHSCSVR